MKVLVFKAVNQLHPVHNLRTACKGHDLTLACYSPCMEDRYNEYIKGLEVPVPSDHNFYPFKKEFMEFGKSDQFLCELKDTYDIVIRLSDHEMSFAPNCMDRILAPFEDEEVTCVYSDFTVSKDGELVTALHLSQPSPVPTYPIFAFRSATFEGESENMVQEIVSKVHSRHIIDPLVTIYE